MQEKSVICVGDSGKNPAGRKTRREAHQVRDCQRAVERAQQQILLRVLRIEVNAHDERELGELDSTYIHPGMAYELRLGAFLTIDIPWNVMRPT